MKSKALWLAGSIAATAALSPVAQATPTTYFGVNATPSQSVSGEPVTARDAFMSNLTNSVTTQTFESLALNTSPEVALSFTGSSTAISAQIFGDGKVSNTTTDGRFNTSIGGSKWWDVSGDFDIEFNGTAISAFGFYGTDVGDFNGKLTLTLTDTSDQTSTITFDTALNSPSGGLLFFGFVDSEKSYKKITFGNTVAGVDFFGFDDMVIGDRGQLVTVPEPATLALVGLSLVGLAAARRRKAAGKA